MKSLSSRLKHEVSRPPSYIYARILKFENELIGWDSCYFPLLAIGMCSVCMIRYIGSSFAAKEKLFSELGEWKIIDWQAHMYLL